MTGHGLRRERRVKGVRNLYWLGAAASASAAVPGPILPDMRGERGKERCVRPGRVSSMADGAADIFGAGFPDLRARDDGSARCARGLRQVFGRAFSEAEKACQIACGAREYNIEVSTTNDGIPIPPSCRVYPGRAMIVHPQRCAR